VEVVDVRVEIVRVERGTHRFEERRDHASSLPNARM
jgi:hypothetical protein